MSFGVSSMISIFFRHARLLIFRYIAGRFWTKQKRHIDLLIRKGVDVTQLECFYLARGAAELSPGKR